MASTIRNFKELDDHDSFDFRRMDHLISNSFGPDYSKRTNALIAANGTLGRIKNQKKRPFNYSVQKADRLLFAIRQHPAPSQRTYFTIKHYVQKSTI